MKALFPVELIVSAILGGLISFAISWLFFLRSQQESWKAIEEFAPLLSKIASNNPIELALTIKGGRISWKTNPQTSSPGTSEDPGTITLRTSDGP